MSKIPTILKEDGLWAPPLGAAAPRDLCTDCGISRTAAPKRCGSACQFIRPDYTTLETSVHGRPRDAAKADELHFGPFRQMVRARLANPLPGAQWTGITSRIGTRLLETGAVDAVLTAIEHLQQQGYVFVTVAELLEIKGIAPQAGETYRRAE